MNFHHYPHIYDSNQPYSCNIESIIQGSTPSLISLKPQPNPSKMSWSLNHLKVFKKSIQPKKAREKLKPFDLHPFEIQKSVKGLERLNLDSTSWHKVCQKPTA